METDKLIHEAAILAKTAGDKTLEKLSGKDVGFSEFMEVYLNEILASLPDPTQTKGE